MPFIRSNCANATRLAQKHTGAGAGKFRYRGFAGIVQRTRRTTALLTGLGFWFFAPLSSAAETTLPVVAAASDLQFALAEIAETFTRETGRKVNLSFGSSGNFARQIRQGGPYELFLSADEAFVRELAEEGFTTDEGRLYAIGRIGLFAAKESPLYPDPELKNLKAAIEAGTIERFAIANPEHAPYGRAAMEALQTAGLWDALQPHLVLGENVAQAAQFAASGSAQGGIIAYSLALAPTLKPLGNFALLPDTWHSPLRQRMVLLKNAGDASRRFYHFLQRPEARARFEGFGFTLPQDSP